MSSAPTFVVFSAAADQHHVAELAGGLVYRSIAVFADRERATGYAEVENIKAAWATMLPPIPGEATSRPQDGQKGTSVSGDRAGGSPSPRQRSSGASPARPDSLPAKQDRPRPAGRPSERDELVRALWLDVSVPIKDIAARLTVSESRVYQIAKKLDLPTRTSLIMAALGAGGTGVADPAPEAEADGEALATSGPPADTEGDAEGGPDEPAPAADGSQAFSQHGVVLVLSRNDECITYRGKMLDLTANQAAFLAVLLKAAPHPVGVEFILKKLFAGRKVDEAQMRLEQLERELRKALPSIGLSLESIKGVGLKLGGIAS